MWHTCSRLSTNNHIQPYTLAPLTNGCTAQVALLLALFITCFLEEAFKRGRICFLAFFVLVTQGLMWSAHNFLTQLEVVGTINIHDLGQDAINAGEELTGTARRMCAGALLLTC